MIPHATTDPTDALRMIQEEVDAALNPRLGTDSRLAHALTAITYLTRQMRYLEQRVEWLTTEVVMLRENGGRL